ncbi:MAG: C1 family peptidase [Bacillota bacterium]|nr:C1 family peptidase [Bacillota bacterium]
MPPAEYYPPFWPRVTDQWVWGGGDGPDSNGWEGQVGSCVANALAALKEVHEYRQYGTANKYSICYIFGNRSGTESDDGMDFADGLDHLVTNGTPIFSDLPENSYPYANNIYSMEGYMEYDWDDPRGYQKLMYPDNRKYFVWSEDVSAKEVVQNNKYRDIYRAKISSWSRIDVPNQNIDSIKQSIIDNGGVLIGTYIANNFDNLGGTGCDGIVRPVDFNITIGSSKSVHTLLLLGWKLINGVTHWIVHNNWGNWWWGDENRRGICYMPIDYSNIFSYFTVIDSSSRQNAPAPVSCTYAPDSTYPAKYIDANAPEWSNVGTLYFDKKLNYGPYADRWIGNDVYGGMETYHDISLMTTGQTVQFRAKFTNVKPWLIEAGGAETWGWAYSPVYTKSRPWTFSWTHPPSQDGTVALTAAEWNSFTANINEVRQYKGLGNATFTTATSGMNISAAIFNEAVNAIIGITSTSVPMVTSGSPLYASYFNQLVSDLNAVA